jgi:hypothetical protein
MGNMKNEYKIFISLSERKSPLWSPRRILMDNIKMDFRNMGC